MHSKPQLIWEPACSGNKQSWGSFSYGIGLKYWRFRAPKTLLVSYGDKNSFLSWYSARHLFVQEVDKPGDLRMGAKKPILIYKNGICVIQ